LPSQRTPAGEVRVGERDIRRLVGGQVLPGRRKETVLVFEVYERGVLVDRVEERSLVGITDRGAIHRLLRAGGFAVRQEWASYDREPFREGDVFLLVEAVREASGECSPRSPVE